MNPVNDLIKALNEGKNIFLTGAGGTGKSYLLKLIMEKYPHQFTVTSSTGISASLLMDGARTIHSFSGIGIRSFSEEDYKNKTRWEQTISFTHMTISDKRKTAIEHCKRLIIDEVSMISKGQLDLIDQVLRRVKGESFDQAVNITQIMGKKEALENIRKQKHPKHLPFGGIKVIITGDGLQLPPVVKYNKDEPNKEPEYFFESNVWQEMKPDLKTIYLKEIKRTENKEFAEFLHRLRIGDWNTQDFFYLKKFEKNKHDSPPVKLYATNYHVDKYNAEQLALVDSPMITIKARWRGEQDELRELKKGILAPDSLELKVGARVMILVNKQEEDGLNDANYVNGSTGVFLGLSERKTKRKVWIREKDEETGKIKNYQDFRTYQVMDIELDNKNIVSLKRKSWNDDIEEYDENLKSVVFKTEFVQFPVKLCYGLTSHKAQGASIDFLEIDTSNFRSPNQFYVALSRATDHSKIRVLNLKTYHIKTCQKALNFYKELENGNN